METDRQISCPQKSKSTLSQLISSEYQVLEYLESDENENNDSPTNNDSDKLLKVLKKYKNDLIRVKPQQNMLVTQVDGAAGAKRGRKRKSADILSHGRRESEEPANEDIEREVVIERENLNSSSGFNFELSKEDLESLESSPNTNVTLFYFVYNIY